MLNEEQIKLVNILEEYFGKSIIGDEPLQLMTTQEVFNKLQTLYPSDKYEASDVLEVLEYCKYEIIDSNDGSFKWLMSELK